MSAMAYVAAARFGNCWNQFCNCRNSAV